jgi:hypothetical protein
MQRPLSALALVLALVTPPALAPMGAAAEPTSPYPFTQLAAAGTGAGGMEFLGTLNVQRFVVQGDRLVATAALSGRVTRIVDRAATPVTRLSDVPARVPVAGLAATCEALELRLDPVRWEPLGLLIRVDPIRLDDATLPVPGELPRSVLCSLSDRLDRGAGPDALAGLLNVLLKVLA